MAMKSNWLWHAFLLVVAMESQAYSKVYLKAGGNCSYLKSPCYGEAGLSYLYGIGKDWRFYRAIQIRTELLISNSSTVLKNRTVQSGSDLWEVFNKFPHLPDETSGFTDIRYFDIDIQLRYLEIPLLLKVEKFLHKNLRLGLEAGYSFKLFTKDASEATFLRVVKTADWTTEERQDFRFDYRATTMSENYSYCGGGICPTIGMYVSYSKYQVGLRYQVDYIDWVSSIVVGENIPLRIFILTTSYRF